MSGINTTEALEALELEGGETYQLFARAHAVRLQHRGLSVNLCSVVNAKSGLCGEDCKFCAQSAHNDATIDCYPLIGTDEMVRAAQVAGEHRAARFGIVTSGLALEEEPEIDAVSSAINRIADGKRIHPCASLGNVSEEVLRRLKEAGLTRYHCNLETAESYYKEICSTRSWSESVDTIRAAKSLGLATCSGGLFGLGESLEQRVELLDQIRELDVDSVPLNFYHPIPGTPSAEQSSIDALACLRVVAVARLMMPEKEIRVCGGREYNLRDLQSWLLLCGADGLMVGGYLTTSGRNVADDLKMIDDAGFTVRFDR